MNAVRADVEKLVQKELESANRRFPLFASEHEGYAVILEEVEEAQEYMADTKSCLGGIWTGIRGGYYDADLYKKAALDLKDSAIGLAIEAIQVAAMAQKFMDSSGKDWKEQVMNTFLGGH